MPSNTPTSLSSPLTPSLDKSVTSSIIFSKPLPGVSPTEKWFNHMSNNDTNFGPDDQPVTIYDLRGQEEATHIDSTGFQTFSSPSNVSEDVILSGDDGLIAKIYYPEVEVLLKNATGMDTPFIAL